ncbi:MAG TPA: hypothetical protein PLF16_00300 [Candidatus Staskawiczbacteria bacterium]|nr:hypothetical protein [Candidatus Staskawiczbacteria bacterium]
MFNAKYPIKNTSDFITVTINTPEDFPPSSKKATWSVHGPDFEKNGHSGGIDDLQCLLLSMQCIIHIIEEWEKSTGKKCEYTFYQDTKIVYNPPF